MTKRLTRQQKMEQAIVDLLNKMFEIAGHNVTYDDIKDRQDDWYTNWTITMEQDSEWKQWGKQYLMKKLYMTSKLAEREMAMIGLMWGLKFSNYPF
jgi:hypothetical protein